MVEPFASITLPQLSIPSDLLPSEQMEQDSLSSSREPELVSLDMLTEENKPKQTEDAKRYRLVVRSAEEAVRMIRENLEIMQKLSRSAK